MQQFRDALAIPVLVSFIGASALIVYFARFILCISNRSYKLKAWEESARATIIGIEEHPKKNGRIVVMVLVRPESGRCFVGEISTQFSDCKSRLSQTGSTIPLNTVQQTKRKSFSTREGHLELASIAIATGGFRAKIFCISNTFELFKYK